MPWANQSDIRINWRRDGTADAQPLILLNSIGTDIGLWDLVLPLLERFFDIVRIDTRGHGASDVPQGDYRLADMADDVVAVMDAAGIPCAAVAGVSLGGMIAMQMAADHPQRVSALIPICTSVTMDKAAWQARIDTIRDNGLAAIADVAMGRFFSPSFAAAKPAIVANIRSRLIAMSASGYTGAAAAIRDMALLNRLHSISIPTLLIAGNQDVSTPFVGHGEHILAAVPGAVVKHLPCAHLAPLEVPNVLADALRVFLKFYPGRAHP